jgi:AcrR family transcriptional regulator
VSARERILDAAVRRIAREGIDDVRIARIATDAGVSASLVHYHFDSRDALLAEALEHSYERAGDVRIGAGEGEPVTAAERLAAMIDQCLPAPGPLQDDFILWVELWLRAARHPELRATSARLYGRMHDWFREVLADGDARGEFAVPDPGATADRVLALCDGLGIRVLCADPAMPRERARAAVWGALAVELGLDPALPALR